MHASWEVQHDTFSNNVIDLYCILYNKPRMVATFFLQRTTAFILFLIVPSLQISCFRKTKEKQYAKYDLNKRIAARLIWQLVIHSCVIFAYIISRRDGENNGFLAGVSLPPSSRAPRTSLALSFPSLSNACHAGYGLWGKKSQRDLGEGMLGMLVQCTKDLYTVFTVEALCVLSCVLFITRILIRSNNRLF